MPHVVAVIDHVLVSEWMYGISLSRIIAYGTIADLDLSGV